MANVFKGVGINWGVSGTVISGSGIGTLRMQNREHTLKAESEAVKDGDGRTVQKTFYDESEEASFEYIISSTVTTGASNVAITVPVVGATVQITDSTYTQIAGVNWHVTDVTVNGSNKEAAKVKLKLERNPDIAA